MKRKSLLFLLLFALLAPWAANAQTSLFSEDFEDGTMPTSWTTEGSGSWSVGTGDYSASTGAGHGTYNAKITHGSTGNVTKLITPEMDLSSVTTAELSFMYVMRSWAGDTDELRVYYRTSTDGTWTKIAEYTDAVNSWTNVESLPLLTLSNTYQIAFEFTDKYGYGVGIDYINIEQGAATPKPTNLAVSNVTDNSATLSWNENGTATAWQICLNNDETNLIDATENPYTLNNLNALTAYTVKVRSVDGSNTSSWSTEVSFNTTAVAEAVGDAWSDDFEGETCGWELVNGTITNAWAWGTATNNGGAHALYVSNDGGTTNAYSVGNAAMVYATKLLSFADGKYEFFYNWNGNGESTWDFLRVALVPASVTLTAGTSLPSGLTYSTVPSGWIALDGGGKLNLATEWQSMSATVNVTAGNYYMVLAWRNDGSGGTNPPAAVDNVSITKVTCDQDVTNLAVNNITTTGATLSWEGGEATQWQVAYSTTNSFEGATEEIVDVATYTMSGLNPSTVYYAKVRAYCGGEDYGEWSNVLSFPTACEVIPALGYTENFDSYTAGANVLPICWNYINTTTNTTYAVYPRVYANSSWSTYANSAPNCLYFYSYYSSSYEYDPQDQYAILPAMEGLNGKQITLFAKGGNANSAFKVGMMTDPTDANTFVEIATQALTTSYQEFNYILGEGNYVAIMIEAANADRTSNSVYVDDIVIAEAPTCLKPTDLEVTANALTATLTWVSEVGAYEIAHAMEATANPDESIVGTATEATYTMNDLALGDHYFWVRANCGGSNGNSQWVGPVSVHIGYCAPAPASVDGSGISNVTFGMGDYIVNNNTTMGTSVATYLDFTNLTGALQAGVESTIAITYATGYTYGTIIWVDFDNSLSFEESEIIYMGTSTNTNPTTLNATVTIPATTTTGNYVMRIGGTDSAFDSYISGTSTTAPDPCYTGYYGCFQDYTLSVLEAPTCLTPTNLAVSNITGHTAELSWTAGGEETAWQICINRDETNLIDVTTNPYTLPELAPETEYIVMVRANCGEEDGVSEWSNEVVFTTDVACPAPTALTVNNVTPTGATISWEGTAESYNLRYGTLGSPDPTAPVTVILSYPTAIWSDGSGYQMLLDADATAYGDIIPTSGPLTSDCEFDETLYDAFEYLIPANADAACTAENIVAAGQSVTIEIPAGIYDWCIVNPSDGDRMWIASAYGNVGGRQNDYEFIGGLTYTFVLSPYSDDDWNGDGVDVTITGAEVNWTVIENATSPYTIIDELSPETNYIVEVQAVCGEEGNSEWVASNFTTLSACVAPDELDAEVAGTTATLNWTGYQERYSIQYRVAGFDGYYLNETFDGEIGDWTVSNLQSGGGITSNGVDGSNCFTFKWTTNPPQYLISPALSEDAVGKALTFSYKAYSSYYAETFKVGFGTGEETSLDEFTWEDEITTEDTEWHEYETVVPEGTRFFVIQCTSYNAYYLFVDNFVIYDETAIVEPGPWMTADATSTTATLTGLDPETDYEWQVQGVDCDGEGGNTDWSASAYFTTETSNSQTFNLTAGWNWISTYIDLNEVDGLRMLEEALGDYGMTIATYGDQAEYVGDGLWIGLEEYMWTNSEMIMIEVSEDCSVSLEGPVVDPSTVEITVSQGWTWIGYPVASELPIQDALGEFEPEFGDGIANIDGLSEFLGEWDGDFATLQPGQGYMYYTETEGASFFFNNGSKARRTMSFLNMDFSKQLVKSALIGEYKSTISFSKTK